MMRTRLLGPGLGLLMVLATHGEVAPSPAAAYGEAVNGFGTDLYRAVAVDTPGNVVLSPYAAHAALLLVAEGAGGETASELRRALGAGDDLAPLRVSARAFREELAAAVRAAEENVGRRRNPEAESMQVRAANRLFGQRGFPLRPEFLELLEREHSASLETLDFRAAPKPALARINRWAEEQTNGRIRDLMTPEAVHADTRLVLASALHFKARWAALFAADDTTSLPFWLRRGENVPVPTMQQTATYGYLALSNAVAVRLPYVGGQMHMLIILPDGEATLQQVEERLDPALWRALATAPRKWVRLFLPKFRLAPSAMDLEPPLRKLGVTGAFDEPRGSADLGRIAPRSEDEYLAIGSAVQKVFVEVAEEGTEAATVAGMGAEPFGGPANTPPPVVVRVNRPFLFAIQHAQSGACLFLGRVTDPR